MVPASASAGAGSAVRPATEVIGDALSVGYRCFDCAQFYENEKEVGAAFKAAGVARNELFLISKVWTTTIYEGEAAIRAQVDKTLADLQTDYVDLYLIHWPVPGKHVAAYKVLEQIRAEGKVRAIGVSNYTVEDYEELVASGITVVPAVNQIEINPFLYRKNTINFFQSKGVVMQAYRSLRQAKDLSHPVISAIATKHQRPASQILGRWCVQKKIVHMPKSENKGRMEENAQVFDFALDEGDMAQLDGLTTPAAIEAFRVLYEKCVVRDTPLAATNEGVKKSVTLD